MNDLIKIPHQMKLIVVAKTSDLAHRIRHLLSDCDVQVVHESTIDRAVELFNSDIYGVVIITSDTFRGRKIDAFEMLEIVTAKSPSTQILFLVEKRDIKIAMKALRAGAYQYTKLPIEDEELELLIKTAIADKPIYEKNFGAQEGKRELRFENMIGQSAVMQEIYKQSRLAGATDIPVLIAGETGTGKDLVAQAIHQQSSRSNQPFVPVHLGALPTELVASELFGHEKGAFTGAEERREGVFEFAHKGTVFLDEIGTIDAKVQIMLLRLLDHKKFHRIGGRRSKRCDVRLVAATNQDLETAVDKGVFREDLYYRLNVFQMTMPPLTKRYGDFSLLINEFITRYNRSFQKKINGISPDFMSAVENYDWPGNIRELKNVIQRAVLVCNGSVLGPNDLPSRFVNREEPKRIISFELGTPLEEIEKEMILQALDAANNNRSRAAELLGIGRRSLYNKLEKYSIPSK